MKLPRVLLRLQKINDRFFKKYGVHPHLFEIKHGGAIVVYAKVRRSKCKPELVEGIKSPWVIVKTKGYLTGPLKDFYLWGLENV